MLLHGFCILLTSLHIVKQLLLSLLSFYWSSLQLKSILKKQKMKLLKNLKNYYLKSVQF